ncbi:MAG: argininosuccinate lyase [Dictyoglomaceae bacterium]
MALWESRWGQSLDKNFEDFSFSLSFDSRLWEVDLLGTSAHLLTLKKAGIISEEEWKVLKEALMELKRKLSANLNLIQGAEDIHTFMEEHLTQIVGNLGKKIHAGRSRNDQVALDLRLYLRKESCEIAELLLLLLKELLNLSHSYVEIIMPGYTHLQHAQPVTLGHYFLAYYEMFQRDLERLEDCYKRIDVLPLGCGALAGSNIPLDREYTAKILGFSKIAENSLDAVSDRDFVMEFLFFTATTFLHLSRLSEEIILWATQEFSFIELPESYSTGSSMMPHKRNPDLAELTRGKTGRILGDLLRVMVVVKGLSLSYNRDLQEDKEAVFDALDQLKLALRVWIDFLPKLKFNKEKMLSLANNPLLLSTDIAEYLVMKGVPFREAHKLVGEIVKYCENNKKGFKNLTLDEWQKFSPFFTQEILDMLSPEKSINSKKTLGSPNPLLNKDLIEKKLNYVQKQRTLWRKKKESLPTLEKLLSL